MDTSVWISFFRAKDPDIVRELSERLDEAEVALPSPVWIELLSGASYKELGTLRKLLAALPRYYPNRETWGLMESFIPKATKVGQRFAFADLLIGALSQQNDALLWSLDADFTRMGKLKFVRLFR